MKVLKLRAACQCALILFCASSARAALITLNGTFSGLAANPPNLSTANGKATVAFNDATREISLTMQVHGLSSPAVALHLDSGAGIGSPIQLYLGSSTIVPCGPDLCRAINFGDGFFIPSSDVSALLSGQNFIVVYSQSFPVGPNTSPESMGPEVAAQLQPVPEPSSLTLFATALFLAVLLYPRVPGLVGSRR